MATQVSASLPTNFGKSGAGSSPTGPTDSGTIATDKITEFTSGSGVTIDKALTASAGAAITGAATVSTTLAVTGAITPTGGIKVTSGSLTVGCFQVHTGGVGVTAAATGTDATAVNTETMICEFFVPTSTTFTGVSVLHLATSTGNVQFSIADAAGALVAASSTAATAAVASAAFQQVAFTTPVTLVGPATYFLLMQNSGSNHVRTHAVGNFRAGKKTGEVFGTFTAITPVPTGFTTALGPIADLYV